MTAKEVKTEKIVEILKQIPINAHVEYYSGKAKVTTWLNEGHIRPAIDKILNLI